MAWRGFRRLGGQLRQKVSPNRALAAVLSKVTREEEESLRLMNQELQIIPKMLQQVQTIYKKLSIFLNNLEALSRFEQKKLQKSLLMSKISMKLASSMNSMVMRGVQPGNQLALKELSIVRRDASVEARNAMASLQKHQQLITLSQEISNSMTHLSTKIATIKNVEIKLGQLAGREAKDNASAEALTASIASGPQEEEE